LKGFRLVLTSSKKDGIIWFSLHCGFTLRSVHTNIEIVIKKGGGIRPYEALATLGLS